jgi:hypothetical protein
MATTVELPHRQVDDDEVQRWRFERLRAAGYGRTAARVLSHRADVDLHRAVELIERGCAEHVAFAILV